MLRRWFAQRRERQRLEDSRREEAKNAAIEVARQVCKENNWIWAEPVKANLHKGKWQVFVNAESRGSTSCIVIDETTGAVLEKHHAPL